MVSYLITSWEHFHFKTKMLDDNSCRGLWEIYCRYFMLLSIRSGSFGKILKDSSTSSPLLPLSRSVYTLLARVALCVVSAEAYSISNDALYGWYGRIGTRLEVPCFWRYRLDRLSVAVVTFTFILWGDLLIITKVRFLLTAAFYLEFLSMPDAHQSLETNASSSCFRSWSNRATESAVFEE